MSEIPKVKIKHSESKNAWNIVGDKGGLKYKIARLPYIMSTDEELNNINKAEAFMHAEFICYCFNHHDEIISNK